MVTNNPLVEASYQGKMRVEFVETDLSGILTHVRDMIHKGFRLQTHPLSGSIKPNESPYKSILITDAAGETDTQSVMIIEESILTAKKFPIRQIPEQQLQDMQTVDLSLIRTALEK